MCGLAGYAGFAGRVPVGTEDTSLKEMTETLVCRGPDASAVRAEDAAGLGHTRPATGDLVGGRQPLVLARGGHTVLAVAFTGEVYNHVRLRREPTALGHRFTTRGDSEAVLHAIDAWGEGTRPYGGHVRLCVGRHPRDRGPGPRRGDPHRPSWPGRASRTSAPWTATNPSRHRSSPTAPNPGWTRSG